MRYLTFIILGLCVSSIFWMSKIYFVTKIPKDSEIGARKTNLRQNRVKEQVYFFYLQEIIAKDQAQSPKLEPAVARVNRCFAFYDSANIILQQILLHKNNADSAQFYLNKFYEHAQRFEKAESSLMMNVKDGLCKQIDWFPSNKIPSAWTTQSSGELIELMTLIIANDLDDFTRRLVDLQVQLAD